MTTNNPKPANFINDDIDNEIRKIVKEVNNIKQDLENIKNLLQEPQYKESYPNIRPFFESQKGFDALKGVLLFEKNRTLGKTTQENINVSSAMEILKNIFVDNNSEALKIQKSITDVDQSIKLTREQSEELKAGFKKKLKERSKTKPIVKLLRFLFTKIANKVFKEMEKERLGKPKEELNNLKDQIHKIIDSFNKELNDLMDAYGKGIKGSTTEVSPYAVSDVTSDRFNQRENESTYLSMNKNIKPHCALLQEARTEQESEYVAFDPSHVNIQQQKYETVDNTPQHFQTYDLPKPQRAQISEKPKIAPKPSKEVIERALSKADTFANQKKVVPLVPQRGASKIVRQVSKPIEQFRANQQNRPKELNIPKAQPNRKLGNNIEGLINIIGNKIPMNSPETSPKQSPTSTKKPFAMLKSGGTQNEAPKVQETKQSTSYSTVSKGIPAPPPMPTQDDFKKVKLTSGKELDVTSQINPKKHATIQNKSIKTMNLDDLNKNPLYQKIKASNEKDEPQTKLTNSKTKDEQHTPIIGR